MKVVRNVVTTGRTVISTIHQPSAEVFFLFDELLLLQRGGYQVRETRAGALWPGEEWGRSTRSVVRARVWSSQRSGAVG